MKNAFLTLSGFQLTWLCCVFGEYYNMPLIGFFVGIFYIIIFFYFINNKKQALQICFIFSFIGYFFDSVLSFFNLFVIESNITIGYLPIWFLVLWPSFSSLFVNILNFLRNRSLLAVIMGSLLVPPTYYFGIPLGIATSNNLFLAFFLMIIFWGLLLFYYSIYQKKNF